MKIFLILILLNSSLLAQDLNEFHYNEITNQLYYNGVTVGDSKETVLQHLPKSFISYEKDYPHGSCYYIAEEDQKSGVLFLLINHHVSAIYINKQNNSKKVHTIFSLGIGSTKSDILAVFPALESKPHPYGSHNGSDGSEYLSIKFNNGNGLLFVTSEPAQKGQKPIVTSLRFATHSALHLAEGCS